MAVAHPLEIAPGWTVLDLKSVSDCDVAEAIITRDIEAITRQLAAVKSPETFGWTGRAQGALRAKREIRAQIEIARARLRSALTRERVLLDILRETEAAALDRAIAAARQRHPALFAQEAL
jgi:hypothetical protein